jgi:parallel beta-helix repeat protein
VFGQETLTKTLLQQKYASVEQGILVKNKPILPLAFISVLLLSLVAGTQLAYFASANFFPEQVPSGIEITSTGAVEGTDLIQRSGNVYTFTGDIHRTIVVLRDGVVLDGAGYTLQGSGGGVGVFLQERNGVTIKNLKISNFEYGVKFTWLSYGSPSTPRSNKVIGNTITNNTYGIAFYDFSSGNEVSDNYIAHNTHGVVSASDTVFRNNQFRNNDGAVSESSNAVNDIDTSNTVNGKPIYYWVKQHNRAVPSDAGWVVLKNCSGITVQGLSLEGNADGVLLCYTKGSTISENVIANNLNGITLQWSSNNVISSNRVAGNSEYGIYLDGASRDNNVSGNRIESNGEDGVSAYALGSSTCNLVSQNQITKNQGNGISVKGAQEWKIVGNNITLNLCSGVCFMYGSSSNEVNGNYIAGNGVGIQLSDAVENTITFNTITENNGWGIELNGTQKNNVIHHNNFINNNVTEGLQVRVAGVWSFPELNAPPMNSFNQAPTESFNPPEPEPPKFVAGAANVWDDGKEGNYWSDYTSRYPNASEVGNTGVGDTPFFINENNMDRYPLMAPCETSTADSPSTSPSQEPESEPEPFSTTLVVAASIASAAVAGVGVGLMVYFKKHKH